jgi:glycosyltransferase involved in cell wall biosynthesis
LKEIIIITDTFPPLKASGAVQFRDLAREFLRLGYKPTVLVPRSDLDQRSLLVRNDGIELFFIKSLQTKGVGFIRRTINELLLPLFMIRGMRSCGLSIRKWDLIIWHSPSIFFGPLIARIRKKSKAPSYLIIRDIFPEWAVDLEVIRRGGIVHRFFDAVARYQYSQANVIGVQSPGNLAYFNKWQREPNRKLEVLQNWLGRAAQRRCSIRLTETSLANRKVFVYAGNMGIAQSMDILLDLAMRFKCRGDVGFLFVGRGNDVERLKAIVRERDLSNVLFFDEIDPDEIPDLYAQCDAGIVALDSRHKSHNIPGKFLTYMQSGLPVLANINQGNDLADIIRDERVGQVCETNQLDELLLLSEKLLIQIETDTDMLARCKALFEREFTVEKTVKQIVAALSANDGAY